MDDVLQHQDVAPKWKKVINSQEANDKKKDKEEDEQDLSEKGLESSRMDGIKRTVLCFMSDRVFKLTQVFKMIIN